eukprot:6875770-Lingulodinium_polyedra.AAC.1
MHRDASAVAAAVAVARCAVCTLGELRRALCIAPLLRQPCAPSLVVAVASLSVVPGAASLVVVAVSVLPGAASLVVVAVSVVPGAATPAVVVVAVSVVFVAAFGWTPFPKMSCPL